MKKTELLKIVNPILALLFLSQAASGIFHDLVPYEIFEKVHGLGGFALVLTVAVHVYLNWGWWAHLVKKRGR